MPHEIHIGVNGMTCASCVARVGRVIAHAFPAAHALASKAKATARNIVRKAKEGALDAAKTFVEANSDPIAIKVRYLHADLSIVAPSDDIQITRPGVATLVIGDGAGNGLVINAAAEESFVVESVGAVTGLNDVTYDLGPEAGINVVVFKI